MKRIYKYATGAEVPEGAVYLRTVIQTEIENKIKTLIGREDENWIREWDKCVVYL